MTLGASPPTLLSCRICCSPTWTAGPSGPVPYHLTGANWLSGSECPRSLRHSHVSQLIAEGVDIVTISKRLGHAKPSVTLAIYSHMFHTDDCTAAAAINAALGE
jgi:integrase